MNCLNCQKYIDGSITIWSILSFKPLFQPALCQHCIHLSNILTICHEQFITFSHYHFKCALATLYRKDILSMTCDIIITHPVIGYSPYCLDETAAIVLACQCSCYSLFSCGMNIVPCFKDYLKNHRIPNSVLFIDYNGVLDNEWQWLIERVPYQHIKRLTIWGQNSG